MCQCFVLGRKRQREDCISVKDQLSCSSFRLTLPISDWRKHFVKDLLLMTSDSKNTKELKGILPKSLRQVGPWKCFLLLNGDALEFSVVFYFLHLQPRKPSYSRGGYWKATDLSWPDWWWMNCIGQWWPHLLQRMWSLFRMGFNI